MAQLNGNQSSLQHPARPRLIIGITGASGAILGIRLLEVLQTMPVETHCVISDAARRTVAEETSWKAEAVCALADVVYDFHDIGAAIASGSFQTAGMIIMPCSIKTLSAVANCYTDDLIARAADVTLKEGRPLILVVRETPYHAGHLRLMSAAAASGAVIFPPVPAFYLHPHSLEEMVDQTVGRVLQRLGIHTDLRREWQENDAR